jgi:hypothetical protein
MNQRAIAVTTHVLGILTFFVGPLVVYFLFRKKSDPWLRDHLDESVNYNILAILAAILLVILALVFTAVALPMLALVVFGIGLLIFPVKVVLEVFAAIWAARGKPFHFPLDIKMVK